MTATTSDPFQSARSRALAVDTPAGIYPCRWWVPPEAAGEQPLPIIYVLDGEDFFYTVVEAVARSSRRCDATAIAPAAVVGIGHATGAQAHGRQVDFTFSAPENGAAVQGDCGGSAAFLDALEHVIVPTVERELGFTPDRRVLFGHSLAGFFSLSVLAKRPELFTHHIALSPSLWWAPDALTTALDHLEPQTAGVFIAVGEWEGELPPWQRNNPAADAIRAKRAERAMLERAQHCASQLSTVLGEKQVAWRLCADADHAAVVLAALAPALRFVLTGRV